MTGSWQWEPGRKVVSVSDPRLNRLLVRDPFRYATLSEYAVASGIGTDVVVAQIGDYLECGTLGLETYGPEIFILTAPSGRPVPDSIPDVAPNLWESLRAGASVDDAYTAWSVCRSLERSGWDVETDPRAVLHGLGRMSTVPRIGLRIGASVVPVAIRPPTGLLAEPTGLLGEYERAGAAAVAVVCRGGTLDASVTAARKWIVSRQAMPTNVTVLVLEEPGFAPVLLSSADAAVTPISVDRNTLRSLEWAAPTRR
jgi:hypothetical protein